MERVLLVAGGGTLGTYVAEELTEMGIYGGYKKTPRLG